MQPQTAPRAAQSLPVYPGDAFHVVSGANLGDGISDASEMTLDDVYNLRADARTMRLSILGSGKHFTIAPSSEIGRPGATLALDHCATFMCPDGTTVEAVVAVEVDGGYAVASYLLPLAPLAPQTEYALVRIDRRGARARLAEMTCVSFTRGTLITMADGTQRPIETLNPGDRVLTRDNGPRLIRWVGAQTVRATGAFAPIVIGKGVLNNANALTLSPNHRLFVYQRRDTLGAGRAEVMVKAEYLVNGDTVTRADGGFIDYFQLLFDQHEIIFAEGIAAESLFVDGAVRPALPDHVRRTLRRDAAADRAHALEIDRSLLDGMNAAELLRRSSLI